MPLIQILPYDKTHIETSYKFLVDSFFISFGDDKSKWPNFLGSYSFDYYQQDTVNILASGNHSYFSVWDNEKLIGQIEMTTLTEPASCGYVTFYYLTPEYRHQGLGRQLDEFAMNEFKRHGLKKARLTVSELNQAGQRFYAKCGWSSLGSDPDRPLGIIMEKNLS